MKNAISQALGPFTPMFPNLFLASAPFSDKQISIAPLPVACRVLVMPGATASWYSPLTNTSVEQWRIPTHKTPFLC